MSHEDAKKLTIDWLAKTNLNLVSQLQTLGSESLFKFLCEPIGNPTEPIAIGRLLFTATPKLGLADMNISSEITRILEPYLKLKLPREIEESEFLSDRARLLLHQGSGRAVKLLNDSVKKLDLTVRLANVIRGIGVNSISEILRLRVRDLLKIRNCGRKSIQDLIATMERYFERYLQENKYNSYLENIEADQANPLKGALEILLDDLDENQRTILEDRYGLWEGKNETLQDIGDKKGVTRERIRQIEKKAVERLRHPQNVEFLNQVLKKYIEIYIRPRIQDRFGLITEDEIRDIVSSKTGGNSDFEDFAYTTLSDIFFKGRNIFSRLLSPCEHNVYHLHRSNCKTFRGIISQIKNTLEKKGHPCPLSEVVASVGLKGEADSAEKIKRYLDVSTVVGIDITGKVGLREWKAFNPNTIHNMAYRALEEIGKPTHFTEIWKKMGEIFRGRVPENPRNVHSRLVSMPEVFVRTAMGQYGLVKWNIPKPPFIKDYIVELMENGKRPLPKEFIKEKTLTVCNCKEASIQMMLDLNRQTFRKYPDGNYGLTRWH